MFVKWHSEVANGKLVDKPNFPYLVVKQLPNNTPRRPELEHFLIINLVILSIIAGITLFAAIGMSVLFALEGATVKNVITACFALGCIGYAWGTTIYRWWPKLKPNISLRGGRK